MPIHIETLIESKGWRDLALDRLADRACRAALAHLDLRGDWIVSVLGCDDARIAALNADFRGKGQPTNVLSWPSQERGPATPGTAPARPDPAVPELGDIAIALGTCRAEATAAGIPEGQHVSHLIVHAMLHLLGYDHETDRDADLMEGLEVEILAKLGLPDPYEAQAAEPDAG